MGNKPVMLVPKDLLIPIGADGTREFKKCADSWTDSEIQNLRARLPDSYHAVPTDWLKTAWINIRKANTPGYKLRGHGPSKDRYVQRESGPNGEYTEWIKSNEFRVLANQVKIEAGWRCQVCNSDLSPETHHRTYETMKTSGEIHDLICLCSRCHEWYHKKIKNLPQDLF